MLSPTSVNSDVRFPDNMSAAAFHNFRGSSSLLSPDASRGNKQFTLNARSTSSAYHKA